MKELTLTDFWLLDATDIELKNFIEHEPYSPLTDNFFKYLLKKCEISEEYEKCQIIKTEIEYRKNLYFKLKTNNFFG